MRQKHIGIVLVIVSLFLANCGEKKTDDAEINYQLTTDHQGDIHDIFSEVELIPLEFAGEYYPHGISELNVVDSIISIEDNRGFVHLFSDKGEYIGCSDTKYGQGPGEFINYMCHSINPADSTVQIVTPNQLIKYDYHFNMFRTAKLSTKIGKDGLIFGRIYDLSDSIHLLMPTGISKNPDRIFKYNSTTEEQSEVYSFGEEIIINVNMQTRNFKRDKDGTLLFLPRGFTGYIYTVDCGEELRFRKKIRIQVPDDFVNRSEFKALGDTDQERATKILSVGKEFPLGIDISSEYIFLLSTNGGTLRDMRYTIINRENGECRTYDIFRDDTQIFPLINYIEGEYAYAVMEKEILEDYGTLLLNDANMAELKRAEPESLILLKYKLTDLKK